MELNFRILEKDNKRMCLWGCVCSVLIYSLKWAKYDKNGGISVWKTDIKKKTIMFY